MFKLIIYFLTILGLHGLFYDISLFKETNSVNKYIECAIISIVFYFFGLIKNKIPANKGKRAE